MIQRNVFTALSKGERMNRTFYKVPCIRPLGAGCGTDRHTPASVQATMPDSESASPVIVSVPGSKSITNRALLLATLASGASTLQGVLFSDDSRHFLKCIQSLGFETTVDENARTVCVTGLGGRVPLSEASLYVGSAGTAARFLSAYLGISKGVYHMDASEQMRRRPMAPLLTCLEELGCDITFEGAEGFFPFTLKGNGFCHSEISVDIGNSSQFLSALLISACLSEHDIKIHVKGTHGMAYIKMTEQMMEQFGVNVLHPSKNCFVIPKGQRYSAQTYEIEPDVSAACYFYAMAPLLHVPVLVRGVHLSSMQGDLAFLRILETMGCSMQEREDGILLFPPKDGILHGTDVDMSACSDQAITLAAVAVFADTPTTIRGIGHIRFQESNRMAAIVKELGKMGIRCIETQDDLTIFPDTPSASDVETYEDHRMAMGFSLIGLRVPDIRIMDPMCCKKTFENYFEVLEEVTAQLS